MKMTGGFVFDPPPEIIRKLLMGLGGIEVNSFQFA